LKPTYADGSHACCPAVVFQGRYRAAIGASPATGGCSAAEAKPAELGRHPGQVTGEHLRGDDAVQLG